MWGLGVHSDVVQYLPDLCTFGDKGDQAHLTTALRAQEREHFVDAGNQHSPQVMRQALGWIEFECQLWGEQIDPPNDSN